MRTIWQRRNASRSLSFILLWILFSNVAMYQSYIHNIAKYVVLTFRISLKNLLFILLHFTLTKLSYISACIFDLSLVLVEQFYMHSWRNGDDETQDEELWQCFCISSDGLLLQLFPSMNDFMRFYVPLCSFSRWSVS